MNWENENQSIFVIAGPGGNLSITNSGLYADKNSESCFQNIKDINPLYNVTKSINDSYGNIWPSTGIKSQHLKIGNSLALYG